MWLLHQDYKMSIHVEFDLAIIIKLEVYITDQHAFQILLCPANMYMTH